TPVSAKHSACGPHLQAGTERSFKFTIITGYGNPVVGSRRKLRVSQRCSGPVRTAQTAFPAARHAPGVRPVTATEPGGGDARVQRVLSAPACMCMEFIKILHPGA